MHIVGADFLEGGDAGHVIDGITRDEPGSVAHRWRTKLGDGAWLELRWPEPRRLSLVQVTFDTGFHRELTLSASDDVTRRMVRGPQPETVRDYVLRGETAGGASVLLAEVRGNHQRLVRHAFGPVELTAVRLEVSATNGSNEVRVYEVRCYA